MRDVSILGVGCTPFGRHPDQPLRELAVTAATGALDESGVARDEVGVFYVGNFIGGMLTGQEVLAGLIADSLGFGPIPCTKVEGACASGGIAFRHAYLAVATGQVDVALAVGVEKMTHASGEKMTAALNAAMDGETDALSGLTYPGLFAMAYRLHANRYGTTRRQVSSVVVKNKGNGLKNPLAQMGKALTLDAVEQAPAIADPLLRYDCCPASDGAAAVVLAATDRIRPGAAMPIRVLASAQTRGAPRISGHPDLCSFDATVQAAKQAFAASRLEPHDLSFVELHDCFSVAEIVDSEDLGVVPRGQGGHWAEEGRTAVGGQIPINPSGGLLSKGHPVGATGVGQIYEAVQQLRGNHPNQIKDARFGLTHNLGGTGVACTVNILARPDV